MTEEELKLIAGIDSKVTDLVNWKNTLSDLLYGSARGEFGYFHKSNILWRIIILWPVMIGSVCFGAAMTLFLQFVFHK